MITAYPAGFKRRAASGSIVESHSKRQFLKNKLDKNDIGDTISVEDGM
jgi:hypothetical protein